MKKFANIVSSVELSNHKKMDWINYVQSTDFCSLRLPTLIIGWEKYKRQFPHLYPNILSKKSNSKLPLSWEFSMEEKITEHFTGIETFVKNAPRTFIELYQYKSIDPISDEIESPEYLVKRLPNEGGFYKYKEEIIYVYDSMNHKIYGIYLNAYKYFGYDVKRIMALLNDKYTSKTIDSDGLIYQSYYRQFPDFDQLKRAMVLFLM